MATEAEAQHQVVPQATGWTLGMTLRPRRVVVIVGVVKMGLGVVKGFDLLRIRIFGYYGLWVSYL